LINSALFAKTLIICNLLSKINYNSIKRQRLEYLVINEVLNLNDDMNSLDAVDESIGIFQMVTGVIEDKKFWAYLSMYPSRYEEYRARVEATEIVNLEEYGEVIEKGWGAEPPQEVIDRMTDQYGIDVSFEDDVNKLVQEMNDKRSGE
jgi:hypothetical protein